MGFGSLLKQSIKNQFSDFENDFKEGFFGADYVRDYKHASKTFAKDGYALAPTNKFLFHAFFTLNTQEIPGLQKSVGSASDASKIGVLVKTATLPSFHVDTEVMNQYNRKRHIQKKINYQPVTITFHDDGSDLIRSMWANYYSYYYNDSNYGYDGQGSNTPSYNNRDIYDNMRSVNDWGFSGEGPSGDIKPSFFKDIKLYTLNKGNFKLYTMINPIITDWQHDTHDVSAGSEVMQHTVTFNYEVVKYGNGRIGNQVRGFADSTTYDATPSPLRAGSTASTFGVGGILDSGESIVNDLASGNILGAIRTGGSLRNTLKNVDVGQLLASDIGKEAISQGTNFLTSTLAGNTSGFSIPTSIPALSENFSLSGIGDMLSPATNTFQTVTPSLESLQETFNPDFGFNGSGFTESMAALQNSSTQGISVLQSQVDDLVESGEMQSAMNFASDIMAKTANTLQPSLDNLQQSMQPALNSMKKNITFNPKSGPAGNVTSNGQQIGGQ